MTNEIQALAKDLIDDAIVTGKKEIVIVTCGNSRSVTPSEFSELKQIITLTLPDVILKYEPTV